MRSGPNLKAIYYLAGCNLRIIQPVNELWQGLNRGHQCEGNDRVVRIICSNVIRVLDRADCAPGCDRYPYNSNLTRLDDSIEIEVSALASAGSCPGDAGAWGQSEADILSSPRS